MLDEMEVFYKSASRADAKTEPKKLGKLLGESVDRFNAIFELSQHHPALHRVLLTTDSRDKDAMRALSEFEQMSCRQRFSIPNSRLGRETR